jgi:hypothetical protein
MKRVHVPHETRVLVRVSRFTLWCVTKLVTKVLAFHTRHVRNEARNDACNDGVHWLPYEGASSRDSSWVSPACTLVQVGVWVRAALQAAPRHIRGHLVILKYGSHRPGRTMLSVDLFSPSRALTRATSQTPTMLSGGDRSIIIIITAKAYDEATHTDKNAKSHRHTDGNPGKRSFLTVSFGC